MHTNFYIARRIAGDRKSGTHLSKLMVRIATASVAVGVAIMITAMAVVIGFRNEIRGKAVGFSGHITLTHYDQSHSFETVPINKDSAFIPELKKLPEVTHIQAYATKGGIIKTGSTTQGVVLKGIASDFDWTFFQSALCAGQTFAVSDTLTTNAVLLSKRLAAMLEVGVGDAFEMYFIQDPPRVRKFTVSGLYDAQLEELDKVFVLCDIKHIQRLNGWQANEITGIEIMLNRLSAVDQVYEKVNDLAAYHITADGTRLQVRTVRTLYSGLFYWLELLNTNVAVILTLMIVVAGFNMISGLLILLFEKISMIGLLKSLGMRNADLQKIFLYRAAFIVAKGLLFGNIIGITVCVLQQQLGIVTLNPDNYFVSVAPIDLHVITVLLINALAFIAIMLMLLLPVLFIARVSPDKTMKME